MSFTKVRGFNNFALRRFEERGLRSARRHGRTALSFKSSFAPPNRTFKSKGFRLGKRARNGARRSTRKTLRKRVVRSRNGSRRTLVKSRRGKGRRPVRRKNARQARRLTNLSVEARRRRLRTAVRRGRKKVLQQAQKRRRDIQAVRAGLGLSQPTLNQSIHAKSAARKKKQFESTPSFKRDQELLRSLGLR